MAKAKPKVGTIMIELPEELLLKAVKLAGGEGVFVRQFVGEVTKKALEGL